MGLLSNIIVKGITTAARNSTIKAVGEAAVKVISETSKNAAQKEDAKIKNGILYIKPTRSSENYINENTMDVVSELFGVGFESITLKPLKKLSERAIKKYGMIRSVSINGSKEFAGIRRVAASSHIIIEYLDFKEDVSRSVYDDVSRIKSGKIYSTEDVLVKPKQKNATINDKQARYCIYCGEPILNERAKYCAVCGKEI